MSSTLVTAATTRSGLVDVLLLVAYLLVAVAIVTIVHERRGARRTVIAGPARDVQRAVTVAAPTRSRGVGAPPRRERPARAPDKETPPARGREPRAPSETKPSPTPKAESPIPKAESPPPKAESPPLKAKRADTAAAPIREPRESEAKPAPARPAAAPTQASPVAKRQDVASTKPTPRPEPATSGTSRITRGRSSRRRSAPPVETCEIVWWRGLVKSQFYAALTTTEGDSTAIGTSPLFRLVRGEQPEPADEALAAHRALVSFLRSAGWEPAGQGDSWYALRFHRVKAPPEAEPEREAEPRPSVAEPEAEAAPPTRPAKIVEPARPETTPSPVGEPARPETRPSPVGEPVVSDAPRAAETRSAPSPPREAPPREAETRSAPAAGTRPAPVAERTAGETTPTQASSAPEVQTAASATRLEPDAAPEVDVDRCTIDWWRGFVKSQFFAGKPGGEGLLDAIELSPLFRWREDGPPEETDEAVAAHRTLVANLRASGWEPEPSPPGAPWYALGFRRERS